jgi:hypothetical protein
VAGRQHRVRPYDEVEYVATAREEVFGPVITVIGRFGGQWAVSEFTTEHWGSVQRTPRDFPM